MRGMWLLHSETGLTCMSLGVFLQSRLGTRIQLMSLRRQLHYSKQAPTQYCCRIFTFWSRVDYKSNADMFCFFLVTGSSNKLLPASKSQDWIHCKSFPSSEEENHYWDVAVTHNDLQMASFKLSWSTAHSLQHTHTHTLNSKCFIWMHQLH